MDDLDRLALQDLKDEVDKEIERTPGLKEAIVSYQETGSCSAAPMIFGAMTRLDLLNNDDRLRRAYEHVTG